MKVIHINSNYIYTKLHGLLIDALNRISIINLVYSPVFIGAKGNAISDQNIIVSECFLKYDRYLFDYKQKKIVNDILKRIDFADINCIHAYTLFTDGNVAMKLSKSKKIPYVVAVRNTDVNLFFKKLVHLRRRGLKILENANAVFFLSPQYRDFVYEEYVPKEMRDELYKKTYVIPNGIDDFWLNNIYYRNYGEIERKFKNKEIHLIYVGAISKGKNISTTLQAIITMKSIGWNVKFTIIGPIKDTKVYQEIVDFPDADYVGPKEKDEIITYLREADVFVMPSINETFGLVYAEALSQGLPVIYSKGQGFDGQFQEGEVGYHVDCKNANEIVSKIVDITNNYESISRGCIVGVSKFRWDDIAKKYKNIYEIIDKK